MQAVQLLATLTIQVITGVQPGNPATHPDTMKCHLAMDHSAQRVTTVVMPIQYVQ